MRIFRRFLPVTADKSFRRRSMTMSNVILGIAILGIVASASSADAYYGHRSYRVHRGYHPYGNRNSAAQRANAAMIAARARVAAAQSNLNRSVRQARTKAENSSAVTSAKSSHVQAVHDYEAARAKVIADLKAKNPEFRDLYQQCQVLREKIVTLTNAGDPAGNLASIKAELKSKSHQVGQVANDAINADPTIKDIVSRQAAAHSTEASAMKDALESVSQDPAVQAARKQLAQASQQAQLAARKYANTVASANSMPYAGRRSYHRGRVGYVAYGGYGNRGGSYHRSYHHPHAVHASVVHVRPNSRRHR